MKVRFLFENKGETVRFDWDIAWGCLYLGRKDAQLLLEDPSCSSQHACLYMGLGGLLRLRDLDSQSGTFVNGIRVHEAPLNTGDEIQLGDLRLLILVTPGNTKVTESPQDDLLAVEA